MTTYSIVDLVTCHNRKEKTVVALQTMFESLDCLNLKQENDVKAMVFLTDDGCTDGTSDAVQSRFPTRSIKIIQGDGHLFWAGGMRLAWKAALKENVKWDFFLLMNDDTCFCKNAFEELLTTHHYAVSQYGRAGIYAGIISSFDGKEITYGGKVYSRGLFGKSVSIKPNGRPQACQMTNANILLVSSNVADELGILDGHYRHSCADWAYGIEASRKGFPVFVTGSVCGYCDNDHDTEEMEKQKFKQMAINERRSYFQSPLHSTKDILYFMRKYNKWKYPFVILARTLNIYLPSLYYALNSKRAK